MMTMPDNLDLTHLGSFDKSLKWAGTADRAGPDHPAAAPAQCCCLRGLTPTAGD
jgi:hypothetical protein